MTDLTRGVAFAACSSRSSSRSWCLAEGAALPACRATLIEPTLTAWRQARLDRRPTGAAAPTDLRDIFDAILYLSRTDVARAYLPHDFPPHGTEDLTDPPTASQGTDAAKKIVGRERSVATDALGLLLAVVGCAASVSEYQAGVQVLDQAKDAYPPWRRPGSRPIHRTSSPDTPPLSEPTPRLSIASPRPVASTSSNDAG
ncbi:hypothetical protein GCM10009733_087070 [Nonomuraea maheshkhaliensis]|uniref:Uncharacterized protein n=1 Tax=Nonomuraea maheshkhaliensis TaxID=419590 RepID=A0ABN2GTX7_9ACTN